MADDGEAFAAWSRFCDALREAGRFVGDDGVDEAEGFRHLTRLLRSHLDDEMENADVTRPQLGWTYAPKMGQDNPDGLYQQVPLDTARTYRLWGNVGTVRYLGLSAITWTFGRAPIELLLQLNGDELPTGDTGDFEIVISPDPAPADAAPGTWHQVRPAECRLLVRQFFADWEREDPAELHAECMDPGDPPPRLDTTSLADRLAATVASVGLMGPYWHDFARDAAGDLVNEWAPRRDGAGALGGSSDQFYGHARWRVGPDEALLYEVTPPDCAYWMVQLGDRWYQSLDFVDRQTSLNDHQAVLDDDGVFRAVICGDDPGVANWLDTAGCDEGYLTYRWNQADRCPVPTLTLVSRAEVDGRLPAAVARVTPTERAEILRRRRIGALRRYRR